LGQLIESPGLRQTLAAGARATVQSNWLLSSRAPDWLRLYQQLVDAGCQPALAETQRQVLARIARQVEGRQRELEEQLRALGRQATEQTLEAARLAHELAEIHASPAWHLALRIRGWRFRLAPGGSQREKLLDNITLARRTKKQPGPGTPGASQAN